MKSQRNKISTYPSPYTKIKNGSKNVSRRLKTIKLLEEHVREMLQDMVPGKVFGYGSKGKGNKTRFDKWDYIQLKHFCTAQDIINRWKRQHTTENICNCLISIKRNSNNSIKNYKSPDKKWTNDMNTHFSKWPTKFMKNTPYHKSGKCKSKPPRDNTPPVSTAIITETEDSKY